MFSVSLLVLIRKSARRTKANMQADTNNQVSRGGDCTSLHVVHRYNCRAIEVPFLRKHIPTSFFYDRRNCPDHGEQACVLLESRQFAYSFFSVSS